MSYLIKGTITDSNDRPSSGYTVKVFDKEPWYDIFGDEPLGVDVTLDDGTYRIKFTSSDFQKPGEFWEKGREPQVYLKISDPSGNPVCQTKTLDQPTSQPKNEEEKFEVVVIGSGFGGTIISLSFVNKFANEDKTKSDQDKRRVCILERGQWWVSHEVPISPGFNAFGGKDASGAKTKGMLEYLDANDMPYHTWAYPDNLNGISKLVNVLRIVDRRGLYDYRILGNVHVLAASGVGGGSLVYANVTEEPDPDVVDAWDSQLQLGINYNNLKPYFDAAKTFIGVNKITTTTALGSFKLARTKVFQEAAENLRQSNPSIVRNKPQDLNNPYEDIYAANLSITDLPQQKDVQTIFKEAGQDFNTVLNNIKNNPQLQSKLAVFLRKYATESNICERQGRCVLGCIPGARHTNNKKIFDALQDKVRQKHIEIRPLCEAYDVEPLDDPDYKYKVYYLDYSVKDLSVNYDVGNGIKISAKFFKWKDGESKFVLAKKLFLCAGSIGSTELLLKATNSKRTSGNKLKVSDMLGKKFSTNGDLLGVVNRTKVDVALTRGPIVTSAIRFNEGLGSVYTIEDSGLPKMFAGISGILSNPKLLRQMLGLIGMGSVQNIMKLVTENAPAPLPNPNLPVQISEQDLSHVMLFSGMGTDSADGVINLKEAWDPSELNAVTMSFDLNKQKLLFDKMRNAMERLADNIGEGGAKSFSTPLWDSADISGSSTIVLHPLGGCPMGRNRTEGVVDNFGEVYDGTGNDDTKLYSDFYVVDGAIIPTALGVNSSLTIAALAFRIAEKCVQDTKYLPVEKVVIDGKTKYLPR